MEEKSFDLERLEAEFSAIKLSQRFTLHLEPIRLYVLCVNLTVALFRVDQVEDTYRITRAFIEEAIENFEAIAPYVAEHLRYGLSQREEEEYEQDGDG